MSRRVFARSGLGTGLAWLVSVGGFAAAAAGQPPEMPPSPVRFTEARSHDVRRTISLTGSVASRRASLVATEVAGVVARLRLDRPVVLTLYLG